MITSINEFRKIYEIGEGSQPYNYEISKNSSGYDAHFTTSNGDKYEVYMSCIKSDNSSLISFDRMDFTHGEVNTHDQYKITSTVMAFVKEILELEPWINIISFEATKKNTDKNPNQRLMLYLAYAKKNLGDDWTIRTNDNVATLTRVQPVSSNDEDDDYDYWFGTNENISNDKMIELKNYLMRYPSALHLSNLGDIRLHYDHNTNSINVFMDTSSIKNMKRLSCTFYTGENIFRSEIYEYGTKIYTYEFKLMDANQIEIKEIVQCIKNAIEISLRIAQPMRSKKIKTDTYNFTSDFIISDDINVNEIIKRIIDKFKLNEPCKHTNLKAEFTGGGFMHTCVDCGADVYVPRKQEEKPKYTGNEYWRSGWNKGYGPQSEEEYRTGKWKK